MQVGLGASGAWKILCRARRKVICIGQRKRGATAVRKNLQFEISGRVPSEAGRVSGRGRGVERDDERIRPRERGSGSRRR